jgi:hypothetical protein
MGTQKSDQHTQLFLSANESGRAATGSMGDGRGRPVRKVPLTQRCLRRIFPEAESLPSPYRQVRSLMGNCDAVQGWPARRNPLRERADLCRPAGCRRAPARQIISPPGKGTSVLAGIPRGARRGPPRRPGPAGARRGREDVKSSQRKALTCSNGNRPGRVETKDTATRGPAASRT